MPAASKLRPCFLFLRRLVWRGWERNVGAAVEKMEERSAPDHFFGHRKRMGRRFERLLSCLVDDLSRPSPSRSEGEFLLKIKDEEGFMFFLFVAISFVAWYNM